jgi:membrane protein DedA with SNARE-associated domain
LDEWILSVIKQAGYLGIGLLMILENIVPAIPSELILPFAGYLSSEGELNLVGVIASGSAGSTAGATAWYVLGRKWSRNAIGDFVSKHGKWVLLDAEDLDRAFEWFKHHKRRATFFGRLVPGVRSLISIPAGVECMPAATFLAYTTAGSVIWTSALAITGYALAGAYKKTHDVVGPVGSILFGAAILVLIVRQVRRRRRDR